MKVKRLLEWEEIALLLAQTPDEATSAECGVYMKLEERKNTLMEVEAREPTSSETNQQERGKKIQVMRKIIIVSARKSRLSW